MDDRDALTAGLPSRRDDEPDGLRDDIVDELADHLACAYRREILRGVDGETARRRVLERFGHPAAVARRLWLDAMRGRIMTQRVLVVCCLVLTTICIAMAFLMLSQSIYAQRMLAREMAVAEANRRAAEEARKQMLEQLAAISKAKDGPQSSGWIPVTFKLTKETPDGPPAAGFHVSLGRGTGGASKPEAIQRVSGESGMVDFGVVQPGDWEYFLTREIDHRAVWTTTGQVNVPLVYRIEKTIVCPKVPPDDVSVRVKLLWPKDVNVPDLRILAGFEHQGFTFQPPIHWELNSYGYTSAYAYGTPDQYILMESQGIGDELYDPLQVRFWAFPNGRPSFNVGSARARTSAENQSQFIFADVLDPVATKGPKTELKRWMPGTYRMAQLVIIRPSEDEKATFAGRRYDVLKSAASRDRRMAVIQYTAAPDYESRREGRIPHFNTLEVVDSIDLDQVLPEDRRVFKVEAVQPNDWTIHVPDALVKAVKERLTPKDEAKKD